VVLGVDGWINLIHRQERLDGIEFEFQDDDNGRPVSCTCRIYRKDMARPIEATEYMEECARNTAPWQSHPRRMLRHKALIQAARIAFGLGAGIVDPDEAEGIPAAGEPEPVVVDEKREQILEKIDAKRPKKRKPKKAAEPEPEPQQAGPEPQPEPETDGQQDQPTETVIEPDSGPEPDTTITDADIPGL